MKIERPFGKRHRGLPAGFCAIAFSLCLASQSTRGAQVDLNLQTIALSGTPAPAAGTGISYASFGAPFLGPSGHVVVRATLSGPSVTTANDRAIHRFNPGSSATQLAREGLPAPGLPFVYGALDATVSVDARGSATFSGTLANAAPSADTAVWGGDANEVAMLWREGSNVPGTPNALVTIFPPERVFASPTASLRAFSAVVATSSAQGKAWSETSSEINQEIIFF